MTISEDSHPHGPSKGPARTVPGDVEPFHCISVAMLLKSAVAPVCAPVQSEPSPKSSKYCSDNSSLVRDGGPGRLRERSSSSSEKCPSSQLSTPAVSTLLKRRHSISVSVEDRNSKRSNAWKSQRPEALLRASHTTNDAVIPTSSISPPPSTHHDPCLPRLSRIPPQNSGIFLELGSATLTNEAWHYMLVHRSDGERPDEEAWMRDESLDMALEVLRQLKDCEAHGIDILSSVYAQMCFSAAMFDDGVSREYDMLRSRCSDKRYIFVPINDGMSSKSSSETVGTHWSLICVDVGLGWVHYYDGLGMYEKYRLELATQVGHGLMSILSVEPEREKELAAEYHSPSQVWDNQFQLDSGPCGPYVWQMTGLLVDQLISLAGSAVMSGPLQLDAEFVMFFRCVFHSLEARMAMRESMVPYKLLYDAGQDKEGG